MLPANPPPGLCFPLVFYLSIKGWPLQKAITDNYASLQEDITVRAPLFLGIVVVREDYTTTFIDRRQEPDRILTHGWMENVLHDVLRVRNWRALGDALTTLVEHCTIVRGMPGQEPLLDFVPEHDPVLTMTVREWRAQKIIYSAYLSHGIHLITYRIKNLRPGMMNITNFRMRTFEQEIKKGLWSSDPEAYK